MDPAFKGVRWAAVWTLAVWVCVVPGCGKAGSEQDFRSPEVLTADRMWSRGGIEEAKSALEQAAEIASCRFAALYRLGILWIEDDPERAMEILAEASALEPEHPGPVFFSGLARNTMNDFAEADRVMRRGYEMARLRLGYALPDTGSAAAEGFLALGRGEYTEAVAAFQRALQDQPEFPQLWLLRAMALEQNRALDPAREAVDRALDMDPEFPEARVARARMTALAGNPDAARMELESVLETHPNLASAHYQMGHLHLLSSDFRPAALSFWWSLLDNPTGPAAHNAAASTLSHMQLPAAAMPYLRRVETINSFLGRYYGRQGFAPRR